MCQLGGSNPKTLAAAAKVVAKYGYDEINLNCGCPSERVAGAGCFGAAMMLQPQLVAQCCQAMQEAVPHIPITVKCRLGKSSSHSTAFLLHVKCAFKSLSHADLVSVSLTAYITSCMNPRMDCLDNIMQLAPKLRFLVTLVTLRNRQPLTVSKV